MLTFPSKLFLMLLIELAMKRFFKWVGIVLAVLLALGVWVFIGGIRQFKEELRPKVALEQYEEIVTPSRQASEYYSFLPSSIDPRAEKASFFHLPGFLQGGDVICLRLKLPQGEVDGILKGLKASGRTEVAGFGERLPPRCYPEYGIQEGSREDFYEVLDELPKGFRIYLFKSDLQDIKKNWNHNFLAFTAISIELREVVYYVNNW